ncbi:multiple PDZ domain protein-like, partial [Hyalella azteca]|uniref:Multiple PDZ domain protein-like n=1 Tax=Hyalella azteca TaxID=294128 RepID=A0A979FQP1_HYAAZ
CDPSLLPQDFSISPSTAELVLLHHSATPPLNGLDSPSPLPSSPLGSEGGDQLQLLQLVADAAPGRQLHTIKLQKPPGSSLGVSVVGLRSEVRGELGIYVQSVQSGGIAHRDGRLREGDQVLSINGQLLTTGVSHQQAIEALQRATDIVELVVARAPQQQQELPEPLIQQDLQQQQQQQHLSPVLDAEQEEEQQDQQLLQEEPQLLQQDQQLQQDATGAASVDAKPDMVLMTGWAQVYC